MLMDNAMFEQDYSSGYLVPGFSSNFHIQQAVRIDSMDVLLNSDCRKLHLFSICREMRADTAQSWRQNG